jgi:hypothetical protein
MATIKFEATFRGGIAGFAEFTISKLVKKNIEKSIVRIDGSGTQSVELSDGFYGISLFGLATPGGATIKISAATKPNTPSVFEEGPISKGYTLILNSKK